MNTDTPVPAAPSASAGTSRRGSVWVVAVLIIVGCGVAWWFRSQGRKTEVKAGPERLTTVAVVKVTREDLAHEVTMDAEFRPYQDIDLFAKVAGFVESINVDVGDQVKVGQLLATLEIPELKEELEHAVAVQRRTVGEVHRGEEEARRTELEVAKADAGIKRAEAAYAETKMTYDRLAAVSKAQPGLVAQQELDVAQARERTASAQVDEARAAQAAAKASVAAAKAGILALQDAVKVAEADLHKLQAKQGYAKITSPFTGIVTRRYADTGDLVRGGTAPSSPAMALVRLAQNERLRLVLPVSVTFVSRITNGFPVEVHVEALNRTFPGNISRFTREVLASTRTMEAEVNVVNKNLDLTPGMYATARLLLDRRNQTLVVPVEAVARQKTATVLVVNRQNQIEERTVKIGLETATKLEILTGLKQGDLVAVGARGLVKPGQKVQAREMDQGGEK
ncbi:MAG: efflux RND transporter periplasmic adaptor subunit [Proteobacteria bacterium]|nr:efflux RND transporter periplasmic adaptor subunit [Pseudomonadota bacterium]